MSSINILGVVGHISYLTLQAIPGTYTDSAFRGYDKDIRQLARDNGLSEFKLGNQEVSLLHFNVENTKTIRDLHRPWRSGNSHSNG